MNTVNFLAGQNISWSIFCVSSETIFQQFTVFIKAELTQVFEMLRGKKCLGGRRVGHIWEANALLHYLWWIDNNNCATLAGSWAKYVKRIAFIDSFNLQCTVSKSLYTRRAIPKYFIKNMSKNKLQLEGIFIQTKVDISETQLWRLPSPQW